MPHTGFRAIAASASSGGMITGIGGGACGHALRVPACAGASLPAPALLLRRRRRLLGIRRRRAVRGAAAVVCRRCRVVHVVEDQPEDERRSGDAERQAPFDAGAQRRRAVGRRLVEFASLLVVIRHGSLLRRLCREENALTPILFGAELAQSARACAALRHAQLECLASSHDLTVTSARKMTAASARQAAPA